MVAAAGRFGLEYVVGVKLKILRISLHLWYDWGRRDGLL